MAALQRVISHADAGTRAAALYATLEADAKGASSPARSADLADLELARLRSCAGSLASACLTARPDSAELTSVEFCISSRPCLGKDLCRSKDDACVCGRSIAVGGTHSLIFGVLWLTEVARHNALTEVRLRIAAGGGI